MKTELINLESMQLQPASLFAKGGLEELLTRIETEARALVPDTQTVKGRKAIASNAARIPRSKTYLDELGKNLTADLKEQTKAVDVERKTMRDRLDALKLEVRKPLTEWEEAERLRVSRLQSRVANIGVEQNDEEGNPLSPADLRMQRDEIQAIRIDESWGEFKHEAEAAKTAALVSLGSIIDQREAYEAEQAELARLRKEKEARDEADRVEQIKQEATAKAQKAADERAERDREEADARLRDIQRRAEREHDAETARLNADRRAAEQRAYEAEEKAAQAAQAAQDRVEEEQRKAADAIKKREADKVWRAKVEEETLVGLTTFGLSIDQAKVLIVGIRLGQVPNVSIKY